MKKLLFASAAVIALCTCQPQAQAWPAVPGIYGNGGAPPGCIEVTIEGSFTDGSCNGPQGPVDNVYRFQQPTCYTAYCVQSAGTMALNFVPPWKVPFVDYATGIDAAYSGALKDPATENWSGTGCTYSATGNALGGPQLSCNAVTGNLTLNGFNFSEVGGHGCTAVFAAPQTGFTVTISNNYFGRGTATYGQSGTCFGLGINGSATHLAVGGVQSFNVANAIIFNNVFDYGTPISQGFTPVGPRGGTNTSITMKYNHFKNIAGNPIQGSPVGFSFDFRYNSIDGYTFSGSQNHGEVYNLNGAGDRPLFYDINNLVLHTSAGANNNTADHWVQAPVSGTGSNFLDAQVIGTVNIGNCTTQTSSPACGSGAGGYGKQVGASIYLGAVQQATKIKKNYTWMGGNQNGAIQNAGGLCVLPLDISGNINMQDGTGLDGVNYTNAAVPFNLTGSVTSNILTTTAQSGSFVYGVTTSSRIKDGVTDLGRVGTQRTSGETGFWDGTLISSGTAGTIQSTVHGAIIVGMRIAANSSVSGNSCASNAQVTSYNSGTGAVTFGTSVNCPTGSTGWSRSSAQTTGRISGTTLTIESVGGGGTFYPGMLLDGVGVTPGTAIGASFCSAGNAPGSTCTVTISQTVASGTVIHGGAAGGVGTYNFTTANFSSRALTSDMGCD